LKKQSEHFGAILAACGGWARKKQSQTVAVRSRLPVVDRIWKKQSQP
jgi:hypothetical protein